MKKLCFYLLSSLSVLFFSVYGDYRSDLLTTGLPIINSIDEKDTLPGCFRMSKVVTLPMENGINYDGIANLNISGSAQFSELSLDALIRRVGKKRITIVNLRQEDGGFIEPMEGKGAISISYLMSMPWWTGENPEGNRNIEQIEQSEEDKMAEISKQCTFTVYGTSDSYAPTDTHGLLYKIDIAVKSAFTEKTLVKEKGLGYFRIPDKKFGNMEFKHVDHFVDFVKGVQPGEWLHFHCKKGQSRTTLFMIMYDMMRNADKVSPGDIIKRHGPLGIGGADLYGLPSKTEWDHSFKKGWKKFLYQFHEYAKANMHNGYSKSWTDWADEQEIEPLPDVKLGDYYVDSTVASILPTEDEKTFKEKILVVNSLNESKLKVQNFRSSDDIWLDSTVEFAREGLKDLRASGSNQYSRDGLVLLVNKLKVRANNIVIVDLRHDDHLFVNGLNVSTFESKEVLLEPRSPAIISHSEKQLKEALLKETKLELHAIDTKYPKNTFDDRFVLTLRPSTVETPEELVKSLGVNYLLIGSKRFSEVSDGDIDFFISNYKANPADTWYHFHCKKGKSRTTFFLVILDMMRNADKLTLEEIVHRQHVIGGIDLFDITPKDPSWENELLSKKQWIVCLARFHRYVIENKESNFKVSWTKWSEKNADYTPSVDHLVYVKR
jgi:hypothetical protein